MRFGSVCSGIEAASEAWNPLGWRAAWFSEIAPFPSKHLATRYPETPNHGSLIGLAARLVGEDRNIDVLVGGTPCQSFSVSGLRGGLADVRGNLALEFARLAQALRPRWLLWENVPGVLSSDGGRAFASLLRGLSVVGYGLAWRVLDAQFFGVAQRRERVFLVGHLGAAAAAGAVLFEPEGVRRNPPSREEAREDVAGALGGGAGGRGWCSDTDRATFVPEIAKTPRGQAQDAHAEDLAAYVATGNGVATKDFAPALTRSALTRTVNNDTPLLLASFDETQVTSRDNRSSRNPSTAALTKTGRPPAIAFNARQDPDAWSERSGPLDTDGTSQGVCAQTRVRRITPRECERLQGFPDDSTAIGKDSPRYAALGNSMAVPVMRWIGKRMELVDRILREAA